MFSVTPVYTPKELFDLISEEQFNLRRALTTHRPHKNPISVLSSFLPEVEIVRLEYKHNTIENVDTRSINSTYLISHDNYDRHNTTINTRKGWLKPT